MVCGIPKRVVQKYFYHFKVPLRYRDVERLLELCSKPDYDVLQFPKRYSAETLIRIKRALEDCRRNEGLMTRAGAEAESNLLEAAADMGSSTAIALLCGARMRQPDAPQDDLDSGSELLRQLMDADFPLAFKVSGDLAAAMQRPSEAQRFYERALDSGLDDQRLRVECLRNVGHLAFAASQLVKARSFLSRACKLAEDAKQVADCHFLLAQLRETDRIAARQHLEVAAANGFHNAFVPLGTLLLNWFGEAQLAREWFKLAITTDTTGAALVGLLDAAAKLNDTELAKQTIQRISAREDGAKLLDQRQHIVKRISAEVGPSLGLPKTQPQHQQRSGRFDF